MEIFSFDLEYSSMSDEERQTIAGMWHGMLQFSEELGHSIKKIEFNNGSVLYTKKFGINCDNYILRLVFYKDLNNDTIDFYQTQLIDSATRILEKKGTDFIYMDTLELSPEFKQVILSLINDTKMTSDYSKLSFSQKVNYWNTKAVIKELEKDE